MDLYAYQFMTYHFDLEKFILDQHLPIHRLRGCRFMEGEENDPNHTLSEEEKAWTAKATLDDRSGGWHEREYKCIRYDESGWPLSLDLSKVHGKARKAIKFALKKDQRARDRQMGLFNDYVGKKVLMIHTRTGGGNRFYPPYEMGKLAKHSLYLADCDDSFDSTYADIYISLEGIDITPYLIQEQSSPKASAPASCQGTSE